MYLVVAYMRNGETYTFPCHSLKESFGQIKILKGCNNPDIKKVTLKYKR